MDGSELAASIAADRPARPPPTTITVGTSMLQNGRKMKRRRAREQEEMQRMIFFYLSPNIFIVSFPKRFLPDLFIQTLDPAAMQLC